MVVYKDQNISLIGVGFIKYVKKHIFGIKGKKCPDFFRIGAKCCYGNVLVNLDIVRHTSLNALIVKHTLNAIVCFERQTEFVL